MDNQTSKNSALFIATVTSFMAPFMLSAVNVALPTIEAEFKMNAILLSWIVTASLLSTAIFLIPFGKAADIYGRKKVFLYGIVLFTFSTLFSGLSTTPYMLIVFRIFQGLSSAMTATTGMAMLISVFPIEERGKVLGINVAAVYLGLSLGPFLGGTITHYLGWRSIFFITVPLGLISYLLTRFKLKGEWAEAKGEKLDYLGSLIYGFALIGLISGASMLPKLTGIILILSGILLLIVFIRFETTVKYPVFNIVLFKKSKVFTYSNIAALINYSATFATTFLLSLYLQYIKGFTPQMAGTILIAQPIIQFLFSPFAGKLSDKIEPRIISSIGMAFSVIGLFLMIFLNTETSVKFIVFNLMLLGLGFALFSSPNTNTIMSSVEKRYLGVASGLLGTMS